MYGERTRQQLIEEIETLQREIGFLRQSDNEHKLLLEELVERGERYEGALQESETLFHSLVDHVPDPIIILDWDGIVLFASRASAKLVGLPLSDAKIGVNIAAYLAPESIAKSILDLDAVKSGTAEFLSEYQIIRTNGERRWVEALGAKIIFQGRDAVLTSLRDTTERRLAEETLKQSMERLRKATSAIIDAIALAVESRDPYTAGHQTRVALLAVAIAKEMGLPSDRIEGLRMAGIIHDLGKISIPAEILSMPRRLMEIEHRLVKTHPEGSYLILKDIDFPWPIAQIVYQHHEKMNGSGYPRGLSGDEILLEARILVVADVVEAMSSYRPYRASLGIDAALEEIVQGRGELYDPGVVDACLRLSKQKNFGLA
jgi:PAS domain S-box-containing protein